jgi:rhodanese-related sulfurtransferase
MNRYKHLVEQAKAQIKEINCAELQQRLQQDTDYFLLDVREQNEWQQGHIPNAIHISRGLLEVYIERLITDPHAEIILYCGGGGRSALAAVSLQQMGYKNVQSLATGIKGWIEEGKELVSPQE